MDYYFNDDEFKKKKMKIMRIEKKTWAHMYLSELVHFHAICVLVNFINWKCLNLPSNQKQKNKIVTHKKK